MTRFIFQSIFFVSVGNLFVLQPSIVFERSSEIRKSITVAELQKMDVSGLLGYPLGTVVTIEGKIADDSFAMPKRLEGQVLLRIFKVNDKQLATEQVLAVSNLKKLKKGSEFKFIGYETGKYDGVPDGVIENKLKMSAASFVFVTSFFVTDDGLIDVNKVIPSKKQ